MSIAEVVAELEALDRQALTRGEAESALARSAHVRRWLDGLDVRLSARISACADADPRSKPADETIAAATRTSARAARRLARRSGVAERIPELGAQLGSGAASGEHADVVQQALARLPAQHRDSFISSHGALIAAEAGHTSPDDLREFIEALVRDLAREHGIDRLTAQKRQVAMRTWTDRATGMWRFSGQFDPEAGLVLQGRIASTLDMLFREEVPQHCPDDQEAKQAFLRAHALLALTEQPVRAAPEQAVPSGLRREPPGVARSAADGTPASGRSPAECTCRARSSTVRWRTELVVIVDERTLRDGWHECSHVDTGAGGMELPLDSIRRMALTAAVVPVFTDANGVVVRVGGGRSALDQGRTTRLANRAQRRALRAMHPTCGIRGCRVVFDHCQPHHVIWWRHGGPTDLANLIPLCHRHHHLVHDGGWTLHLARDRTLTATLPDGTQLVSRLQRRWPR